MRSVLPFSRRELASFSTRLGVGIVLATSLLSGCSAGPAQAVINWAPFVAKDKSFAGNGPAGWEVSSGERGGTEAQVIYTQGNATISANSDSASSFLADALRTGAKPAIEVLHEKSLTSLGESLGKVEGQAMQILPSKLGAGRYCEFTANNGSIHGYHVTIQGSERMIYVNAYCPESDWMTLKPAFSRFIADLKPGTA